MSHNQKIGWMRMKNDVVIRVDFETGGMAKEVGENFAGETTAAFKAPENFGVLQIFADANDADVVGRIRFGIAEILPRSRENEAAALQNRISLQRKRDDANDLFAPSEIAVDLRRVKKDRNVAPIAFIPAETIHVIDDAKIVLHFWAIENCVSHKTPLFAN